MDRVKKALLWVASSPLAGLSPWIVYVLVSGPNRIEEASLAALATAAAFFAVGRLRSKSLKPLELFDMAFFGALALFVLVASDGSHEWLELWSGEVAIVALVVFSLGAILFRSPFTLQYARDDVDPSLWQNPVFIHINYVITWVWTAAFVIGAASGFYGDEVLKDSNNLWTGWVIQTAALIAAADVTVWYPARARADAAIAHGHEPDEPRPKIGKLFGALSIWVLDPPKPKPQPAAEPQPAPT